MRERGDLALLLGRSDTGFEAFEAMLELNRQDLQARYGRGRAQLQRHRYDDAIADFDYVLARAQANAPTLHSRGLARLRKGSGTLPGALADFQAARKLLPDWSENNTRLAFALLLNRHFQEAFDLLQKVLQDQPQNPLALSYQAFIRFASGDSSGALGEAERAIALRDDIPEAYFVRASALFANHEKGLVVGVYDRALADLDKALSLYPGFKDALVVRGLIHVGAGDLPAAAEDLRRARAQAPKDLSARITEAVILAEQARLADARALLDALIAEAPDQAAAYYARSSLHLANGDGEAARADLRTLTELQPGWETGRRFAGAAYLVLGEFAAAAENYRAAWQASRSDPFAALWLYVTTQRSGADGLKKLQLVSQLWQGTGWPEPLFQLFLGEIGADEVLGQLPDGGGARENRDLRARALTFLAQWHILQGDPAAARTALEDLLTLEFAGTTWRQLPDAELSRLAE